MIRAMDTHAGVRLALGATAALTMTLCGCSSMSPAPVPSATASPALRIVTSDVPNLSGMEALLEGTLAVDSDGCVHARTEGGAVTLVWPQGYTVRGDAASFEVLDASNTQVIDSGSTLAIGGGVADTVNHAWSGSECATGMLWMVGEIASG